MSYHTREYNEANWDPHRTAFALRVGKVVNVNPVDHTVDVLLPGGGLAFKCRVLEMWAGTDYGDRWSPQFIPDPGVPETGLPAESWQIASQERRDTWALIGFANGEIRHPFCLGFWFPEISEQMVPGFQRLTRHVGDTYSAVSEEGDHYIAFDQTGSYVAFHRRETSRPPDLTQKDARQKHFSARPEMYFTVRLSSGATLSLDGGGGTIRLSSPSHIEHDASRHLDLYAGTLVLRGLEDAYLGREGQPFAGWCLAPFSGDDTLLATNLTVNAAYDRRLGMREGADRAEALALVSGWRFLADGDAGRIELGPDGRLRSFAAIGGLNGAEITWESPQPHYQGYFVDLNFPTPGIQRFVVPPKHFTVTGVQVRNASAWTSSIGVPTEENPVTLEAGTMVEVEVTAIDGITGAQLSFWGNRG